MEDELEDLIFIQFYQAAMKVVSRFSLSNVFGGGGGGASYTGHILRMTRLFLLRPDVLIATALLLLFLAYLQFFEDRASDFIPNLRLRFSMPKSSLRRHLVLNEAEKESIEIRKTTSVAYSILGKRSTQEDRFVLEENLNNDTGISFFAIFDGHGGNFAVDFAKDILVQNLCNKMIETSNIMKGKVQNPVNSNNNNNNNNEEVKEERQEKDEKPVVSTAQRRKSFKKSLTEESLDDARAAAGPPSSADLLLKLNNLIKPLTKEDFIQGNKPVKVPQKPKQYEAKSYIEQNKINFGKMMTDEVLAADFKLVEQAKKNALIAGTTALMLVIHEQKLIVANVGDSRGVMCDAKGNAIPLSFDHKPQQIREQKRITDAGGFIAFKGVWRVAGILATSRALGDYPLKDRNLVIANPDILTFDLLDHKPQFLILASDGLWDTFSNEEAVAYIKEHQHEEHFGAKSIVLQSYDRGSLDNITVIVVVFKDGRFEVGKSSSE